MSDPDGARRAGRRSVATLLLTAGLLHPAGGSALARAAVPTPETTPSAQAAQATQTARTREQAPERYAVVVHPSTPVSEVTLGQLRRIFRGEQQYWSGAGRERVVLFVQAPGTSERGVILRRVYDMDEGAFQRYWIGKTFRDEVASGPKIVSTSALARRLAATIPGGVAVIPVTAVDGSVRVLRVGGHLPDEADYPLVDGGHRP
jgi:phosphate transport system substrate-binding protein